MNWAPAELGPPLSPSDSALPTSRTPEGQAGLRALLEAPGDAVVAVDYDGTLAPIVDRPDEAYPQAGALAALTRLAEHVGVVALITGRPAPVVVELAGLAGSPVLVLGQYGLQRWDDRTGLVEPDPLPGLADLRTAVRALLEEDGRGLWLEDKGHSLVVHARGPAERAPALAQLDSDIRRRADAAGFEAHDGRSVLELRPPGHDKGGTLTALLDERGASAVLFAGDDVGDLPAFVAVEQGRAAGRRGTTVCSDSAEVAALRERADVVVDGPPGVVALLSALADAIDARHRA